MHETAARTAPALWPHDDTEWSVVGTDLHQGTITDARTGINEAAVSVAPPGGAPPFQAGGQTLILGMRRPNGTTYRVLPDVFVYRGGFDPLRRSLSLRREGSPALVIEVLSQDTREVDLDMAEGKGWTYAAAGVAEYLILDPIGRYVRTQVQGHHTQRVPGTRLAGGLYAPWGPDRRGRWASALGFGFGLAAQSDYAVAAADAVLALPEMSHGLPPLVVLSYLHRFVPYKRAFELAVTSRRIGAAEAREAGVVTEVVPPGQAVARAMTVAQGMAAQDPRSLALLRRFSRHAAGVHSAHLGEHAVSLMSVLLSERAQEHAQEHVQDAALEGRQVA